MQSRGTERGQNKVGKEIRLAEQTWINFPQDCEKGLTNNQYNTSNQRSSSLILISLIGVLLREEDYIKGRDEMRMLGQFLIILDLVQTQSSSCVSYRGACEPWFGLLISSLCLLAPALPVTLCFFIATSWEEASKDPSILCTMSMKTACW